jgi:alpha-tubulin suppressor-like RCC1 family protein
VWNSPVPISIPLEGGVTEIAAGGDSACAIQYGRVKCWGRNFRGQLGDATGMDSAYPVEVRGVYPEDLPQKISVGMSHACVVKTRDGSLYCWGSNLSGQLGNDAQDDAFSPVAVNGMDSGVTAVSAGVGFTCAIKSGQVFCWGGGNDLGKLGNGTNLDSKVPVAVDLQTEDAISVSAGFNHACLVRSKPQSRGNVWCWGDGRWGALGGQVADISLVPTQVQFLEQAHAYDISAGIGATCAWAKTQDARGTAFCWGSDSFGLIGNDLPLQTEWKPARVQAISW